jgi:hypothetical protein
MTVTRRAAPPRGRGAPSVTTGRFSRRTPQVSTSDKVLGRAKTLLPGSATKRTSRGGGPGSKSKIGLAAVAGALAVAVKNRERLTRLLSRDRSQSITPAPAMHPTTMAPGDDPPAAA